MDANGASQLSPLTARVAALECAIATLARRWEAELAPRLVELEAQLDNQADQLADVTAMVAAHEEAITEARRQLLELGRAHTAG